MSDERYDQDEVAAILKRSAEIEAQRRAGTRKTGLSLADLEGIAEESGLDPSAVRAAARELAATGRVEAPAAPLAAPDRARLHEERSFPGELDEAQLEQLVGRSGPRLRLPGGTRRTTDGWSWAPRGSRRRLSVRAESRRGRTTIQLDEELGPLSRALHGGLTAGLGSFGFAFAFAFGSQVESSWRHALALAILGGLAALGASFGLSRALFRRVRGDREVQLQALAAELDAEGRALEAEFARSRPSESAEAEPDRSAPALPERNQDGDEGKRRRSARPRDRSGS